MREPNLFVDGNETAGTGQWAQQERARYSLTHSFTYSADVHQILLCTHMLCWDSERLRGKMGAVR